MLVWYPTLPLKFDEDPIGGCKDIELSKVGTGKVVQILIIIPLRGPSCRLILARLSAKLRFQDRAEYGNIIICFCTSEDIQRN
jgi:hypothetical protein